MATIEVNGVTLGYDDAGEGPVVVFSHAGVADRRMWEHQFQDLSADHRVIRYDWRGYGESGDAAGEFAHHRDLLGLMDALDVDRAALVGCSMGGGYSVEAALAAPGRVSSLALICSGMAGYQWPEEMLAYVAEHVASVIPADRLTAYRERRGEPVRNEDVAAMALAQARFLVAGPEREPSSVDPEVWRSAIAMLEEVFVRSWSGPAATEVFLDPPSMGRLAELRVPTLVVNGLDDVSWIQEISSLLAGGIPDARRLDLPGTGHLPPLEHPELTTTTLRDFLTAPRAAAR